MHPLYHPNKSPLSEIIWYQILFDALHEINEIYSVIVISDILKILWRAWCEKYGDVVLEVVKKEFKEHVGEMDNKRSIAREKNSTNSKRWTTFDEEGENYHPNLFAPHHQNHHNNPFRSSNANPFSHSKWNWMIWAIERPEWE